MGLGVVIRKDGRLAAGASSYTAYRGGIEIEIDTKKEYRRKGLACACGARLILNVCPGAYIPVGMHKINGRWPWQKN